MGRGIVQYFEAHRTVTFFAIFFLAFAIRFALLVHYRGDILAVGEEPRIAEALVTKGQFADPYVIPTGPTAHSTPFFPVLLAGIYKVLGFGFRGQFARCLLVISGYSLLFALYPTFASAFGFPFAGGLAAGFISALVPVRRSSEVFRGWEETWAAMALALLLYLMLKRYRSPQRDAVGAALLGLCWGCAFYINFSIFSVLVALLLVDFVINRSFRVFRDVCVTFIVALLVITPWIMRDHNALHGWMLMRDNLGLELRYGNHDHVHPSAELNGDDPITQQDFQHPGQSVPEATLIRDMGEVNYNRQALHLALTWMRNHPAEFMRLSVERFFFFWLGPLNHRFETMVISSYTLLGLAGFFLIRKRVGELQFRLWCTVFGVYPLMYYCVPFAHRYRVPVDWMIWLSAGLFVSVVMERFSVAKAAVPVRVG